MCRNGPLGQRQTYSTKDSFTDQSASRDLREIERETEVASLGLYLSTAKEILTKHPDQFNSIVTALPSMIESVENYNLQVFRAIESGRSCSQKAVATVP